MEDVLEEQLEEQQYTFGSLEDVIKYLEEVYPDEMVLEKMDDFDRIKIAGKTELAIELLSLLKD